jgi:hypothetical protein
MILLFLASSPIPNFPPAGMAVVVYSYFGSGAVVSFGDTAYWK